MEVSGPYLTTLYAHLSLLPHSWDLHVTSSCHRIKIYSVNRSRPETAKRLEFLDSKGLDILPLTLPIEYELEPEEEYLAKTRERPREPLS